MIQLATGLTVRQLADATVVRLIDPEALFDEATIRAIRQKLFELVEGCGPNRLLIDFEDVGDFGSGLLAVLIDLNRTLKRAGGALALCGLSEHQRQVFESTHLNHAFAIYADEESGLLGLNGVNPPAGTGRPSAGPGSDSPSVRAVTLDWLEVVHVRGITIVRFPRGVILQAQMAEDFGRQLLALAAGQCPARLVVNCANVIAIGSLTVGGLLSAARNAAASGGRMALCGACPAVENVLKLTRVVDSARLYPDEKQALAAF
jgi:anti-anti-sigma factor